jgi:hypothetical protein
MKRPYITDNRAQFALRWLDYARANSPRQRRLKARKLVARESLNENISAVGGVLLLAAIIIAIFFI